MPFIRTSLVALAVLALTSGSIYAASEENTVGAATDNGQTQEATSAGAAEQVVEESGELEEGDALKDETEEQPPTSSELVSTSSTTEPTLEFSDVANISVPNDVGSDGAFTYSVPIKIPVFRGLEPNLALRYNSGRRMSRGPANIAGQGWRLSGFSKIERVTEGRGIPSYQNTKDVFLLDGQELVACDTAADYHPDYLATNPNASCTAGGDYTSLRESYLKITRDEAANTFSVFNKDGVKYTYESVGDLAGEAVTGTADLDNLSFERIWLLTSISDTQVVSNVVSISYQTGLHANGFPYRPDEITYSTPSGGTSSDGYRIVFGYEDPVDDVEVAYATGTTTFGYQRKRLVSVRVYDGSRKIRAYKFNYVLSAQTDSSLLTKVEEFGGDFVSSGVDITGGTKLPDVTFEYSSDEVSFDKRTYSGEDFTANSVGYDIDLNGRDEIISPEMYLAARNYSGNPRDGFIYNGCFVDDETSGSVFEIDTSRTLNSLGPVQNYSEFNAPHDFDALYAPEIGVVGAGPGGQDPSCTVSGKLTFSNLRNRNLAVDPAREIFLKTGQTVTKTPEVCNNNGCTLEEFHLAVTLEQVTPAPNQTVSNPVSNTVTQIDQSNNVITVTDYFHGLLNLQGDPTPEYLTKDDNGWYVATLNADNTQNTNIRHIDPAYHQSPTSVTPMDLNGDGRLDLFYTIGSGQGAPWYVLRPEFSENPISIGSQSWASGSVTSNGYRFAFGDFNGDGADDVVYFVHGQFDPWRQRVFVSLSTGNGFSPIQQWDLQQRVGWVDQDLSLSARDINSDGLSDLIFTHKDEFTTPDPASFWADGTSYVLLSTGTDFVEPTDSTAYELVESAGAAGDFDGDGLIDIFGAKTQGAPEIYFGDGGIPNLLIKVANQAGGTTDVTYLPTTEFGQFNLPAVRQAVTSITSNDGRGNARTVSYSYEGGAFDYHLRRSLGFAKVTATLPAVNDSALPANAIQPRIETEYLQTRASAGRVSKHTLFGPLTYDPRTTENPANPTGNEATFAQVRNTYAETGDLSNLPLRSMKTETVRGERFLDELLEKTEQYALNIYGEPESIISLGYGSGYDDITTQFWYQPNTANYIVSKPWRKLTVQGDTPLPTWNADVRTNWIEVNYFQFDGQSPTALPLFGNMTRHRIWNGEEYDPNNPGVHQLVENKFEYDNYGNVTSEIDAKLLSTTHEYETDRNLFRIKSTNAVGHEVESEWDTACQQPTKTIDPNDLETTFIYDVHCRETTTTLPRGAVLTTSYQNIGNPTAQYIEKSAPAPTLNGATNRAKSREYFDGFGQTYLTARSGVDEVDASMIAQVSHFDARGNLAWKSLPRTWSSVAGALSNPAGFSVSDAQKTRFDYDTLNRPVRTLLADGNQHETSYGIVLFNYDSWLSYYGYSEAQTSDLETFPNVNTWDEHCFDNDATTDCGWVRASVDSFGNTVHVTVFGLVDDAKGAQTGAHSTQFWYDPKGNLLRVLDALSMQWTYIYDHFNNRTDANDPGLGRWAMEYDLNDNLTKQTDAIGQVIEFEYDDINRQEVKRVISVGGTTVTTDSIYDVNNIGGVSAYNIGHLGRVEIVGKHRIDFAFNKSGMVKNTEQTVDGDTTRVMPFKNQYYLSDTLQYVRAPNVPGGNTVKTYSDYIYDTAGRLIGFGSHISDVEYNLWDQPTKVTFGSTDYLQNTYDGKRGWIKHIYPRDSLGAQKSGWTRYERTATGRVWKQRTDYAKSRYRYTYDYAGRLLFADQYQTEGEAVNANTLLDQTFTYDTAGRMLSNSFIGAYVYPGATQVGSNGKSPHSHAPDSAGGEALAYDDTGNMTAGLNGKVMTYDAENRPLSVSYNGETTTYVYAADGTRLKKIEQQGTANEMVTVYLGGLEIRDWGAGAGEEFLLYPLSDIRIRTTNVDGVITEQVSTLIKDQLGSIRAIYDAAGVLETNPTYQPFGKVEMNPKAGQITPETKGFLGERYDAGAGLQYLNARYYDPELALFIQPDWFEVTMTGVGTNRYSYAFNDPVNLRDPSGNCLTCSGPFGAYSRMQGAHYNRNNTQQSSPDTRDELNRQIDEGKISINTGVPANAHQQGTDPVNGTNPANNSKVVTTSTGQEGIYDENDNLVNDNVNQGTVNYADPESNPVGHVIVDVVPYVVWGNTEEDPTSFRERLAALFGIENGCYRESVHLTKSQRNKDAKERARQTARDRLTRTGVQSPTEVNDLSSEDHGSEIEGSIDLEN